MRGLSGFAGLPHGRRGGEAIDRANLKGVSHMATDVKATGLSPQPMLLHALAKNLWLLLLRGIAWSTHQPLDRFNELLTVGARMSD